MVTKRPRIVNVQVVGDDITPVQTRRPLTDSLQAPENEASQPNVSYNSEGFFVDTTLEGENIRDHSQSVTTKRRGPTMMSHVWNLPKNKMVKVDWNGHWQLVGVNDLSLYISLVLWRGTLLYAL